MYICIHDCTCPNYIYMYGLLKPLFSYEGLVYTVAKVTY